MDKIKQVFSHDSDKSTKTGSTHTGTASNDFKGAHSVASDRDNINGAAGPTSGLSHGARDTTGTGSDLSTRNNTTAGAPSTLDRAEDRLVGGNNQRASTGTTSSSTGGVSAAAHKAEVAGEHLTQHAAPPKPGHHHERAEAVLDERAAADATHDRTHVAPVVHTTHREHEVEEVQRQTEIEKHHHHVQHHVQPVLDTQHSEVQHHEQIHPVSHIQEKHVNTDADRQAFAGLNKHKDEHVHAGKERTVVDKGEVVTQHDHHHVHHVVQPVIERDTHEHHVQHTVIPTHHVSHEAPVIHESVSHEPMNIKDFVSGGGDLKSKITHDQAGVLNNGDCERTVDGPLESLKEKLHLGSTSSSSVNPTAASTGAGVNTGAANTANRI